MFPINPLEFIRRGTVGDYWSRSLLTRQVDPTPALDAAWQGDPDHLSEQRAKDSDAVSCPI